MLMPGSVGIAVPIMVLLTVLGEGVVTATLDGKSRWIRFCLASLAGEGYTEDVLERTARLGCGRRK